MTAELVNRQLDKVAEMLSSQEMAGQMKNTIFSQGLSVQYTHLCDLLTTTMLKASGTYTISLKMNADQMTQVTMNRELKNVGDNSPEPIYHYGVRVILRLFKVQEPNTENNASPIFVLINNKALKNNGGVLDLTSELKLDPSQDNCITIKKKHNAVSFATVLLVKWNSLDELVNNIVLNNTKPAELTEALIKNKHCNQSESELALTSSEFTLICPLSRARIQVPIQGKSCQHVECYDARTYIQLNMNVNMKKWKCPICSNAVPPSDIIVDGFWLDMIRNLDELGVDAETVEYSRIEGWTVRKSPITSTDPIVIV